MSNNTTPASDALHHPTQPRYLSPGGVLRFKPNKIVCHLLDKGGIDLNQLSLMGFDAKEWQQFAQLIGYSVSGYSDLSYVDDTARALANSKERDDVPEAVKRVDILEDKLKEVRKLLRDGLGELFEKHPDDFCTEAGDIQ